MKYATWNLSPIDDNYLDGPEASIVERGGSAQPIWSTGKPEAGASILGKVDGDLSNLSRWNVTEISRAEAETFITNNFTPFTDRDGAEHTLVDALKVLD